MSEEKLERTETAEDSVVVEERKRWGFLGLPFTFTVYRMNQKKLTVQSGLLSTHEDDILLYRIMDTSLCRTLWQKLFKLGSVRVASTDQSLPELVIKNIRNARDFKELLDERVERERLRMKVRSGELLEGDEDFTDFDGMHDDLRS
ncbi:MAG: PH domain-containing protein [Ruminococcaceae bacterium]|nr:PH domain-containing protein [Oscillospiraceae bacterium]